MSVDQATQAKVRAFLAKAKGAATGWETEVHNQAALAEKQVYLYVADYCTGWVWMVSIPRSKYQECSLHSAGSGADFINGARAACTSLVSSAADGKPIEPVNGMPWEDQLGLALAYYSGTTRVWQLADRLQSGGHFVTIYYRKPGAQFGLLRPFVFPEDQDLPIPYDTLLEALSEVMARDSAAHPEWFPR